MMNLFSTVLGGMEGEKKGTLLDRFKVGEVLFSLNCPC